MEQIDLTNELDVTGHSPSTYARLLTGLGFSRERNGMRVNFERGLAIEVRETPMGCEVRGYRL